ncbi:MAG TPA: hypothetical protein DD435_05775 [Cyanobacteria bacterium UBA8530]|nr:hypothetical protein [Cyanobacteria bacterium UBA8530]
MTKVLHVLNELNPSGAEVMLHCAAKTWQSRGIDGDILSMGKQKGSFASVLERSGYHIHHVPFEKSIGTLLAFYRLLRKQGPDVIHIHTERCNFWYALLAFLAGVPVIVRSIHNVFSFSGTLRWRRMIQRRLLTWLGVKHVGVGASVQKNEGTRYRNPSLLIPNWYDSRHFRPPTPEERSQSRQQLGILDQLVIVSIGNCEGMKNHPELLKALATLKDDLDILYLHLGREQADRPERRLAEELGIAEKVRFLGFQENVVPFLWASDVYAMPSLHEGFSIAAIEALGVGLMAILADVPGLRDLKDLEGDSISWTGIDAASIAPALREIAKTPREKRLEAGMSTQKTVSSRYSIETGALAYARLYAPHQC